jgi:hypothetical protein
MKKFKKLLGKLVKAMKKLGIRYASNYGIQPVWMASYTLGDKNEEIQAKNYLVQCLHNQFEAAIAEVMDSNKQDPINNSNLLMDINENKVTIGLSNSYIISIIKV